MLAARVKIFSVTPSGARFGISSSKSGLFMLKPGHDRGLCRMSRRVATAAMAIGLALGVLAGCGGGSMAPSQTQGGTINISGTWTGEFTDISGTLEGSQAEITETITGSTATLSGSFSAGIPGSLCGPVSGTLSGTVVGTTVEIFAKYTQNGGGSLTLNGQSNPAGTSVSGNFSLSGGCGSISGTALFSKS
jgi:hypothetical protein